MRTAVNSHALPIHKKNRIASLLCIFETTIILNFLIHNFRKMHVHMRISMGIHHDHNLLVGEKENINVMLI